MDNATIQEFLDEHDYDIRKTHNGRWIDQKCTMDVVCLVSDCIVEYTSGRNRKSFTVNDIWYNDYTVDNVQQIFSKPNPTEKASNEYDKYFGQPIKLLDAAGIIHGEKSGHGYVYSIVNQDLLEYISFRERNCYNFLCLYIEKVLRDSGIYRMFEYFFRLQDKNSFKELKDSYTSFTIQNTPINGATECGRIFTKVLNPLACKYKKCGKLIPFPPKLDGWYHLYRNAPGTIYSSNASIQAFLELDYTQFISAIEFLYPEALFSTEHGVKGEEYDNVIFVISRGWNMYQFETYAPMITGKASIPSGKQISFERNRNLFYVCCSRPRKRLFFFVTIPIDQTFKEFLMELVGKENYYTYSQWIMNKKISQKSNEK